jgi:hypothetical protein
MGHLWDLVVERPGDRRVPCQKCDLQPQICPFWAIRPRHLARYPLRVDSEGDQV